MAATSQEKAGGRAPRARSLFLVAASLFFALASVLGFETATRLFASDGSGPSESLGAVATLANTLLVAGVCWVLVAATGRTLRSLLGVAGVMATLWVVNVTKLLLLGRPVLPWDVFLVDELVRLGPNLWRDLTLPILGVLSIVALMVWGWRASRSWVSLDPTPGQRGLLGVSGLSILVAVGVYGLAYRSPGESRNRPLLPPIQFSQALSYQRNGFLISSVLNALSTPRIRQPPTYSEQAIDCLTAGRDVAPSSARDRPVDVIVILAEAFWDPTRLGLRLSEDPIPELRRVEADYPGRAVLGTLEVPTFGGMTVLTEFEVLTGLPVRSLPPSANPYALLRRPVRAFPELFRESGYRTTAVHPFHGAFWERSKVFPLLGFDAFLDLEDFDDPEYEGSRYVSDESLVDRVIGIASQAPADEPQFIYGISMSTHGPFGYDMPEDWTLRVESPISDSARKPLTTYINSLQRADRALARLLRYFDQGSRDTLVVLFGDHLPLLGANFQVYREAGFLAEGEGGSVSKMREPPVIVWANFPLPEQPTRSPSHTLLPRVADLAGIASTGLSDFSRYAFDAYGGAKPRGEIRDGYALMTYDILFGEEYSVRSSNRPRFGSREACRVVADEEGPPGIRSGLYIAAWGPKQVHAGEYFHPQPDGTSTIWLETSRAGPDTEVLLAGVVLPSRSRPARNSITSRVDMNLIREPGNYPLQLRDRITGELSEEVVLKVHDDSRALAAPVAAPTKALGRRFVAHAGGRVRGRAYSNSLDALELSYARGFRWFEIDLNWTRDRELVLIHDWAQTIESEYHELPRARTLEEFRALRSVRGLEQLDLAGLADWVAAHPDVRIVTDVKEGNLAALARIAEAHPGLRDRLVVQIYEHEEYAPVLALGYSEILLTLYRSHYSDDEVVEIARQNALAAIVMPARRARSELPQRLTRAGTDVYAHTVNDPEEACALYAKGVDGFYTDDLAPGDLDCLE